MMWKTIYFLVHVAFFTNPAISKSCTRTCDCFNPNAGDKSKDGAPHDCCAGTCKFKCSSPSECNTSFDRVKGDHCLAKEACPVPTTTTSCRKSDTVPLVSNCKCASDSTSDECAAGQYCWIDNTCNDAAKSEPEKPGPAPSGSTTSGLLPLLTNGESCHSGIQCMSGECLGFKLGYNCLSCGGVGLVPPQLSSSFKYIIHVYALLSSSLNLLFSHVLLYVRVLHLLFT